MSQMEMMKEPEKSVMDLYTAGKIKLGRAASTAIDKELLALLSREDPQGLENNFSGRFAQVIEYSIKAVSRSVPGLYVDVKAKSMKSSWQEKQTGADLAVFFEVLDKDGTPQISKTLLIQAKVAEYKADSPPPTLKITNPDLLGQLAVITNLTPSDGYVLAFTKSGGFCIKAETALVEMGASTLNTSKFHSAGTAIQLLFECTAGSVGRVSPKGLGAKRNGGRVNINDAADRLANLSNYIDNFDYAVGISVVPSVS